MLNLIRSLRCATLVGIIATAMLLPALTASAETLMMYAAQSGKQALDQGEGGGNPFASALIEMLATPRLDLAGLTAGIERLTERKSNGFQRADVPSLGARASYNLTPKRNGERRLALVMVVSDYRRSGANSLPGAAHDAARVAQALAAAGFETETAVDLDLFAMRQRLDDFARKAADADVAALYATGHGVEVGGTVYMLPGDYPIAEKNRALGTHALAVDELRAAPQAKAINLVFWGGCRDDPLGD